MGDEAAKKWANEWAAWARRAGLAARVADVLRPTSTADVHVGALIQPMIHEAIAALARVHGPPPAYLISVDMSRPPRPRVAFRRGVSDDFMARCDRAARAVGLTRDAWIRQVLEAKLGGGV